MKKSDGKDKESVVENEFSPEGISHPEAFLDDLALVDYLKALLTPPPQVKLDLDEIRFVYNTTREAAKSSAPANADVDKLIQYENERPRIEAKELRQENEVLKLKVARLVAQLNEAECELDTVASQNVDLKASLESLQHEVGIYRLINKNVKQVYEEAALVVEKSVEKATEPESVLVAPQTMVEALTDLEEKLDLEVGAEQDDSDLEDAQETISDFVFEAQNAETLPVSVMAAQVIVNILPDPLMVAKAAEQVLHDSAVMVPAAQAVSAPAAIIPESHGGEDRGGSGNDSKNEIASPSQMPKPAAEQPKRDPAVSSNKQVVTARPAQKSKPSTKILKPQDVKKVQAKPESPPALKVIPPPAFAQDEPERKPEPKPDPVQQQPVMVAESKPEADPAANQDLLQLGVDDTNIEPAPVPKVILRQHLMNYKQLQDEADSTDVNTSANKRAKGSHFEG